MTQLSLKVAWGRVLVGLKDIGRAMPRLANDAMEPILEDARREASGGYSGGSSYTVSKLSGQKYQRTGRYGSTTKLLNPSPKKYTIIQDSPYAQYVGGGAYGNKQAGIHAGRWPLLADVMRKAAERLLKAIPDKMRQAFRDEGIGL